MNDVKLNRMRELNFNEIEEVSGGRNDFWPGGPIGGGIYVFNHTYDSFQAIGQGKPLPEFSSGDFAQSIFGGAIAGGALSHWRKFF
ncbi:MAG: hypothetical protein L3J00_00350 [Thiomicrorhabdus sp.]|nr:hypothetical protein [Thiomicrorhabdus sp.]